MVAVILVFLGIGIAVRLMAGRADRDRIEEQVAARGGRVVSIDWAPFGKGWFGEKNDRIYQVMYQDGEGRMRRAWCKTSMFSGVYLSDDEVIEDGGAGERERGVEDRLEALERENAELRRRLGE